MRDGESLPGTGCEAKTFYLEGGEITLAITKDRKNELIAQYCEWVKRSKALVLTQYVGLTMKEIDSLRVKVRENGGEFHIIKNTLAKLAFEQAGLSVQTGQFEGSTAIVFAFVDAPATVKTVTDFVKSSEFLKIKGGWVLAYSGEKRILQSFENFIKRRCGKHYKLISGSV